MVDEVGEPAFPHLFAALDTLMGRLGAELGARRGGDVVLRGSHGRILSLLAPGGTRPARLAEGWISKQAIGMRIQELVSLGLVVVEPDPADRRATLVRCTPAGEEVRDRTLGSVADIERSLREQVGDDRYEVFRSVLDELAWPAAPPLLLERVRSDDGT